MSRISTYEIVPEPKLADKLIGTSVGGEIEDVTYNFTLGELLNLFLPNIPANNLQGVLDYGNEATQDIILNGTIFTTNLEVTNTATILNSYFTEEIHITGGLYDSLDSIGTPGQVLISTGDAVEWYTIPTVIPTLQEVLTSGNTADVDIILDANLQALTISADNANIGTQLTIQGVVVDYNESSGMAGQILSSTSTTVEWIDLPVYTASSPLSIDSITKVISIQKADSTQDGYLSSTDWITFNGKQNAGSYITALTGEATATGPGSVPITLNNASVIAKVLTGLNVTGGSISASDSILTAFGKVQNQINGLMGGVQYQGIWDANTNTPTLTSSVGIQGYYYVVNVAGSTNLNGITDWKVGDWAIFSGGAWNKVDNTDAVTSVNGQVGAVSLTTDDIPEGTTNLYFLNSRARAAVSATSPLLYDNLTGVFSIQQSSNLQNGYLSSVDWITFNSKQQALSGTGLVKSTAGTITYITDNSSNWNTAYDNMIVSAAVTGTATKTLTLNQQDGGTIQASWSDVDTGLTSVGVSMPSAFNVANSPLTSNGTINITGAGIASQYVRGDGTLANFPNNGGGGSSVNYYLNGSVNQGTFGGVTYYQMSKVPIIGAGTNFTRTNAQGNGYIASFITDAGDPSLLNIPGGNWNLEIYFQSSSVGGAPSFYGEIYKVSSSNVFTLVGSSSTNPEVINNGTTIDQYFTSVPVPQTTLLATDRLAIRLYVITDGRNITLHTEDNNLCEVLTTFSTGLNALNGLTAQVQYFAVGTSGTDFNIASSVATHTFNLPTVSATNRGALSSSDWSVFNAKQNAITLTTTGTSGAATLVGATLNIPQYQAALTNPVTGTGTSGQVAYFNGTSSITSNAAFAFTPTSQLLVNNSVTAASAIARGTNLTPTLVAAANGDVLVGLDINPTFTAGAFTGLTRTALRVYAQSNTIVQTRGEGLEINSSQVGHAPAIFLIGNAANARSFRLASWQDGSTGRFVIRDDNAGVDRFAIFSNGNTAINSTTDAGFRLDVNGTARTQQLHTFLQGTLLDSTSASNFYSVNTGGSTYGGLALRNQTQDYTGYIQTGRSGNANGINFFHTTFAGATSGDGHQKFSSTAVVFGSTSKPQTLTIFKVGGSAGTAQYPLVLNNQTNTTNTGVGLIFQTGNETGGGPIDAANITAYKTNLGGGFVTSSLRFSTINDGANTLSEKMRISDAGNLLVGTTTDGPNQFTLGGSETASSAIARGQLLNTTLVAAANNDVLVGLDINPTFTNGAFTGVSNIGLRVRDGNSGWDQIVTTRTSVVIGNGANQSINAVNTTILALPRANGGGLYVQSNITTGTGLTESPLINFNNANGNVFARLSAVGVSGSLGRLEIGVAQPSTSISGGAFFYAAANRGSTQFALGSDFTDNSRAVIVAHWDGASALILKPNASTTTAPTFRVRNNTDAGDNFLVYGATGNVGINVSSDAGFRLDVNGTARFVGNNVLYQNTAGAAGTGYAIEFATSALAPRVDFVVNGVYTGQFSAGGNDINFKNSLNNNGSINFNTKISGTDDVRLKIFNSGNVQIQNGGTFTDVGFRLDVNGTARVQGNLTVTATNATGDFATIDGTNIVRRRTAAQVLSDIGAQAALTNPVTGTGTTNYLPKFTGSTTVGNSQVFDNGTNVGIGTTSPATNFNVVKSDNGGEGFARFEANNRTQYVEIGWNSINQWAVTPTNAILGFQVNGTERMRINSSGVIRITSQGITNTATLEFDSDATPSNGSTIAVSYLGSGSYGPLKFGTGGSERMRITSGGNLLLGTTTDNGARLQVSGAATFSSGIATLGYTASTSYAALFNGSVGIGTATPDYPLSVQANSSSANAIKLLGRSLDNISILSFFNNANTTQYGYIAGIPTEFRVNSGSSIPITFTNADTERMRITSGGNVGIGTTSPAAKLHLSGNFEIDDAIRISSTYGTGRTYRIKSQGGNADVLSLLESESSNRLAFFGNLEAGIGVNGSTRFYINSSGNVGIGTTSPSYRLSVEGAAGELVSIGTSTQKLIFYPDSGGTMLSTASGQGGEGIYFGNASDFMYFQTASAERMRITSGGNLLVGTTTDNGARLQVSGGGTFSGTIRSDATNGLALGSVSGYRRLQYDNTSTTFAFLRDDNGLASINANAATFSSSVTATQGRIRENLVNSTTIGSLDVQKTGESAINILGTTYSSIYFGDAANHLEGGIVYDHSTNTLEFRRSGNVNALTLGPTGAATFSSSVTAGGNIIATNGTIQTAITYATTGIVGTLSNHDLSLFANNTERMRITSGGNVGIGTTSPTAPLSISRTLSANQTYLTLNNATNSKYNWGIDWDVLGTPVPVAAIRAIYPADNDVSLGFYTYNGSGNVSERMRISSGGNVLIGTTTDIGTKLAVNGTTYTAGLGVNATAFQGNVTMNTGTTYIYNASSGSHTFTLQSASGSNQVFIVKNHTARSLTIATTGGQAIIDNAGASTTTFTLAANKAMIIQQDGGSTNYIISIY